MAQIEGPHNSLHTSLKHIQELIDQGKRSQAADYFKKNTESLAYETLGKIDSILTWHNAKVNGIHEADAIFSTKTKPALLKIQELLKKANETVKANVMTDEEMLSAASKTCSAVVIFSVFALISGVLLSIFLARGIVKSLKRIIESLSNGSDQVNSAAGQVSSSSQQMAEGASEQASSLEEISSSLEEMTSMTKQNANNAKEANTMADDTRSSAEKGAAAMDRMMEASQ